ncbi:MAG: hypothetical protein P1V18_04905 [Candidatus Gracilibacteria bacterium]|nr:hypothetical protein [Candidatus Gracilibacteria bacterium]
MSEPTLNDINNKLDKLLKYQQRQQMYSWLRWGVWIILFTIFVAIPSYYAYDIINNPGDYIDIKMLNSYRQQIEQFKNLLQ